MATRLNPDPVDIVESTNVYTITLSLDTAVYTSGDVFIDTHELANVVRMSGGIARLDSLIVIDTDDVKAAFELLFFQSNVILGTRNELPSISDTDALTFLGSVAVDSQGYLDLGNSAVNTVPIEIPLNLKAGSNSTSIYVAAIVRSNTLHTATGLTIRIGVVRI